MTPRSRRLMRLLTATLVIAVLLAAGGWWLLYTQPGAKWGFERLGSFFPGRLDVKGMRGPLRGPIEVTHFAYRNDRMAITADRVFLRWRLSQLLQRRLDIYQLHGDNVTVVWGAPGVTPEARDSLAGPLPDLNLPVTVIIREGILNRLQITKPSRDSAIAIDRVELVARSVRRDSLHVSHLAVRSKLVDLDFAGTAFPRGAYPLLLRGRWTYRPERGSAVNGTGVLAGTLDSLRITQSLAGPFDAQVDLRLFRPFRSVPRFQGEVAFAGFSPREFDPDLPDGVFQGRFALAGNREELTSQGTVRGTTKALGPSAAVFRVRRAKDLWHIDRFVLTRSGSKARFAAQGTVAGSSSNALFDLQTTWTSAGWPLQGEPWIESERGSARIKGAARDFGIRLDALLAGRNLPPGKWHLDGRGGGGGLRIRTVIADVLDGRIVGAGSIAWEPRVKWNLTFDGNAINPGSVWSAYPGSLSFTGRSEGVTGASGPSGRILVSRLGGTLRSQPVSGGGTLTARQGQYSLSQAAFQWGPNRAELNGGFGHRFSLDWKLDAPQLGAALAQASGSLRGQGSIRGSRSEPRFAGTVAGDSIYVGRMHAGSVRASGDVDLAPGGPVRLDVAATAVDDGTRSADRVILAASGTRDQHRVRASLADGRDSTVAVLAGAFGHGGWRGEVPTLDMVSARAGNWSLASPARLTASPRRVQLAGFVWQSGSARATLDGDWEREGPWHIDSRLDQVPLSLIVPALPPRLRLEGSMGGHIAAHATAGGQLFADVDVVPGPGQVLHNTATGQWVPTRFENARVHATADGQRVQATFGTDLVNVGRVRGTLGWSAFGRPADALRQPVGGTLVVHMRDIAMLQGFTPELDATTGTLDADLRVAGTIQDPYFYGPLSLKNGGADVPRFGLQLREANIEGSGEPGGKIALNGSVRSGTGILAIHGTAALAPGAKPVADLSLSGKNIQAMNSSDMKFAASPNLEFKLDGRRLDITGDVEVPEGTIDVSKQYDRRVVKASPDVVYAGADTVADGGLEVHSRVRLAVGDKLRVRGFGLDVLPTGSVLLIDAPGLPTLGSGRLDIKDGKYNIYGQDLDLETGSLIFGGGPIDNPGVRARASRTASDGVVAGFLVSGTVMQPVVQVFSEPTMGQSEALSYIMFGKPIQSANLSEGQMASTMATTLGVPGTNLLAHGVASGLGIEQARIEFGSELKNASLMLGTHLSPKLFVSAGMDVFQATSSLRLRYILNRIFTIEAETAHQNRVDLLYTVER